MIDPGTAAILNFAARFGLDAAITILERTGKPGATIDDAIASFKEQRDRTPEQDLEDARKRLAQYTAVLTTDSPSPPT